MSKTRPTNIVARERELNAVTMRKAGSSYEEIGESNGTTKQAAYKAVKKYMDTLDMQACEAGAEIRRMELNRLDSLQLGLWERAQGGHVRSTEAILKIMKRRAELTGIDAPAKIDPDTGPAVFTVKLVDD